MTRVAVALFFLSLIILSIIQIEDTDTWVHLSIGREIFRLHDIPSTQPFAFPSIGQEFRYASSLFGLLLYGTYLASGYAGIVLLKSAIVFLAVAILYNDAISPCKERLVSILVLSGFVVMFRYRFVERPDIVLMVLIAFIVHALNAYAHSGRKYLYALPAVTAVWAGTHSSIILIPLPFLAFIAGGIIQLKLKKHLPHIREPLSAVQIKTISVIFILSVAATLINPYPFSQYTAGYGALSVKWAKQYIIELGPLTTWELSLLWTGFIATILSFIVNRKNFSLVQLLLVLPFFVLPFSARRFLFLTGLIAAPVIARNIAGFVSSSPDSIPGKIARSPVTTVLVIVWITCYTALGLAGKPPLGYDFKKFGFGVNEYRVPAGSVRYLNDNSVYGRFFNPFHWGGYIIWTGYPRRTVFIDPMGGLPDELLEKYIHATSGILGSTWILEQLHARYGFEALILDYPYRNAGARDLSGLVLSDPNWALVYWDDVSLLYLRRGGSHQSLIDRDEYRFVVPAAGRNGISSHLGDPVSLARIEADLRRSIRQSPSAIGYGLLGHLCNGTGRYREAVAHYTNVTAYPRASDRLSAYTGLGTAYYYLGDFNTARKYYEQALKIQKDGMSLYNLATVYISAGNDDKAAEVLHESIRLDPGLPAARSLLEATNNRLNRR